MTIPILLGFFSPPTNYLDTAPTSKSDLIFLHICGHRNKRSKKIRCKLTAAEEMYVQDIFPSFYAQQVFESSSAG